MAAYKNFFPRETEADFIKFERRELSQSKTRNWSVLISCLVEPYIERIEKNIRRATIFINWNKGQLQL